MPARPSYSRDMSITPGSDDTGPQHPQPGEPPEPDPTSSAELTPPTNRRRVLAGVAPPVAAILSWILATATHRGLYYSIVAVVAALSAALYRSGGHQNDSDSPH